MSSPPLVEEIAGRIRDLIETKQLSAGDRPPSEAELLFEIAGIPLVTNVIDVLQQFVLEGMLQTTPEPRDRDVSQDLHRTIVDAIRNKNPDKAKTRCENTCR
jgi:DNA-binding FadR family transcriptional regulator